MSKKDFSIIIISKNQKYELKKSVLSLLAQTLKPVEVIVVDVGGNIISEDYIGQNVSKVFKYNIINISENYSDIQLFEIGLKNITQNYVALMVAGDVWDDNKLESCEKLLEEEPELIVHSYYQKISLKEELFSVEKYNMNNFYPIFQIFTAPSSVILKRSFFASFDYLCKDELAKIKLAKEVEPLAHNYYMAGKNFSDMEKHLWNMVSPRIKEKNLLLECVEYFINEFQHEVFGNQGVRTFIQNTEIEQRESIDIVFNYFDTYLKRLEKTIKIKHQYYVLMRTWLEKKLDGKSICKKLLRQKVSTVAIYGAGRHGNILFNDLKKSKIEVLAWIDKSYQKPTLNDIPVMTLKDYCSAGINADLIIVTPVMDYSDISVDLREAGLNNIISLEDLVR